MRATPRCESFGGVDQRKEECRDARRVSLLDDLARDAAYACPPDAALAGIHPRRGAARSRSGIGSTTAIFSLFDALLLKPLPVVRPEELRVVYIGATHRRQRDEEGRHASVRAISRASRAAGSFTDVIAFASLDDAAWNRPDAARSRRAGSSSPTTTSARLVLAPALDAAFSSEPPSAWIRSFWAKRSGVAISPRRPTWSVER